MSKFKIIIVLCIIFFLYACVNNGIDGIPGNNSFSLNSSDPDPLLPADLANAPSVAADLLIIGNINGQIRAFAGDRPADYSLLADNVNTEAYFSDVNISDDKNYLLYVDTEKKLILYNIPDKSIIDVIQENISCNETQFIDNYRIQFSNEGKIYCYTISTGLTYKMIDNQEYHCIHGAVVSPDGSRVAFKNQDPSQSVSALYGWADVTGEPVSTCTYLGNYLEGISLFESFEFIWVDDETLCLKKEPDSDFNTCIKAYTDLNQTSSKIATVNADGDVVKFTKLSISEDRSKLCAYGLFGLYQVDIPSIDFESPISVDEIYKSEEVVTTRYAAYSVDSDYLVAATSGCINIYEADTLIQTNFDSTQIISEGDTLYSIDCK